MTLALLLTAVTGAWAQSTLNVVEFELPADWANDKSPVTAADLPGFKAVTVDEAQAWTGAPAEGSAMFIYGFDGDKIEYIVFNNGNVNLPPFPMAIPKDQIYKQTDKFFYPSDAITVEWNASTKTGTFVMPAFGVEIDPIYAPAAQWAKVENVDQLPTAIEGIYAGTEDAIVNAGTVAKIGDTENAQGEVMYFATTDAEMTAEKAAKANGWLATVPTAAGYDDATTVYVWYYIKGADTPDGQEATAENTFNDSEICATPITVTVLSNKFDIQFKAANDNTIEAGKATVKVGDEAATVTEGKLEGVKMGSEVKLEAKPGYKFRKVEVKKNDGSTRLDESTVGMIVCTNGKAYPVNMKDNLPSGVSAVGIVAYKNGKNGLVMALTDEATNMNWDTATGNNGAKAHTPAVEGYSWKVPTISEWQYNIFTGAGVENLAGLSTYMTAAGGTGLQNGCYWTSTPKNNSYYARCITIENGSINFSPGGNTELKSNGYHVRAVFAF